MPDNLLRPDNRSLGWSTGDVSLYGAQPDPSVTIGRAGDVASPTPDGIAQAPPSTPAEAVAAGTALAPAVPESPPTDGDATPASGAPPVVPAASTETTADASTSATVTPVATPTGGSTPPGIFASTVAPEHGPDGFRVGNGDQATLASGSAPVGNGALDLLGDQPHAIGAPVLDLASTAIGGVQGIVGTAVTGLGTSVAGTLDVLGGVTSQLTGVTQTVADDLASTVGALGDGVADLGDGIVTTAGATAADAVSLVDGATGGLVDAVGAAATALPDATQLVSGVTDPAGGIVQDVGAAVATLGDDVPLAGADPVGGVATLVDLVQTSELFVVGQSDSVPDPVAGGGSIVDSLIGDVDVPDAGHEDDATHHSPAADLVDGLHLGL